MKLFVPWYETYRSPAGNNMFHGEEQTVPRQETNAVPQGCLSKQAVWNKAPDNAWNRNISAVNRLAFRSPAVPPATGNRTAATARSTACIRVLSKTLPAHASPHPLCSERWYSPYLYRFPATRSAPSHIPNNRTCSNVAPSGIPNSNNG